MTGSASISCTRRALLAAVALVLLAAPLAAEAQRPGRLHRIGFLAISPITPATAETQRIWDAFRQGLREHGWVEGKNIVIESRSWEGKAERLPDVAAEMVRLKVDVIVAIAAQGALAAKSATKTIPVVALGITDPVGSGLVTSLARPGGNVTGLSVMAPDLVGKQVELMKEVLPRLSRVAILWNPAHPVHPQLLKEGKVAAQALGVQLQPLEARVPGDFEAAFSAMAKGRAEALLVLVDPTYYLHRITLVELAATTRLPAMYGLTGFVIEGGLMGYGPDLVEHFRQGAGYVDRILRGAKPANLPVEQPTKFELLINLKTAKALGLTLPQSLLLRADRVIE